MGATDGILNPISKALTGRSAFGEPAQMTSTTGPLTSEGQQLWNLVMGQLNKTPATGNINFGGNAFTVKNPNFNSLLQILTTLDGQRRGTMQPFTADQGGVLGGLAPILGAMAGGKSSTPQTDSSMGGMGGVSFIDFVKGLFGSSGGGGGEDAVSNISDGVGGGEDVVSNTSDFVWL